ncbi:MAG: 3'-5' exonuclease [archaeon]
MGHLFLDIETYISKGDENSALNPYKDASKVLVISFSYYDGFKPPAKAQIREPVFLKEWESSEKEILAAFYNFLKKTRQSDQWLKICGFNILKFDIPYLFGRMKTHKIAGEEELYDLLFRPFGTDLMQLSAIISEKTAKHGQLWGTNHKGTSAFFKLQVKEGTGADVSTFYDKKEFGKIMKYCREEFNLEQMLDAFYLHVTEKNQSKKLI